MLSGMQQEMPALVGSADVCAELDIDRATLSRWVASGIANPVTQLPGKSGAFVFHPDEVARLKALRGDRKQMPRSNEAVS